MTMAHVSFDGLAQTAQRRMSNGHDRITTAARGLGWASIAIGLAEIALPRQIESALGLEDRPQYRGILRVLGIRELCHALGILADRSADSKQTVGVWARV